MQKFTTAEKKELLSDIDKIIEIFIDFDKNVYLEILQDIKNYTNKTSPDIFSSDTSILENSYKLSEFILEQKLKGFQWINWVESFRNIAVLVPILFTWAAISKAAQSYQYALELQPTMVEVPFILQWQQGFGGLLNPLFGIFSLSLSDIAQLDFFLILLIIIATIAIQYYSNIKYLKAEDESKEITRNIESIIWRFNYLHKQTSINIDGNESQKSLAILESINVWVNEFKDQGTKLQDFISAEKEHLKILRNYRRNEIKDIEKLSNNLTNSVNELPVLNKNLLGILGDIRDVSEFIAEETDQINKTNKSLDETLQSLEQNFGLFEQISLALGSNLENTSEYLQNITQNSMFGDIQKITDLINNMAQQNTELVNGIFEITNLINEREESLDNYNSHVIESSENVISKVDKSMDLMIELTNHQINFNKQIIPLVEELKEIRKDIPNISIAAQPNIIRLPVLRKDGFIKRFLTRLGFSFD